MEKDLNILIKKCKDLGIINIEAEGELSEDLINDVISSTEDLLNSFDFSQLAEEVNRRENEVKDLW